jgi:hypothetical protein
MAARGVHFALTSEQFSRLLSAAGDDELMSVVEDIEELGTRYSSPSLTRLGMPYIDV